MFAEIRLFVLVSKKQFSVLNILRLRQDRLRLFWHSFSAPKAAKLSQYLHLGNMFGLFPIHLPMPKSTKFIKAHLSVASHIVCNGRAKVDRILHRIVSRGICASNTLPLYVPRKRFSSGKPNRGLWLKNRAYKAVMRHYNVGSKPNSPLGRFLISAKYDLLKPILNTAL